LVVLVVSLMCADLNRNTVKVKHPETNENFVPKIKKIIDKILHAEYIMYICCYFEVLYRVK